jgi:hypothetical protein
MRNGHVLLGFALAAAFGAAACQGCKSGGVRDGAGSPKAEVATVRLYVVADVAGALEPCGCTKDQLGGIDRLAAFIAKDRAASRGSLLLAAGPTFFSSTKREGPEATQDLWKAEALADALSELGLAGVVPAGDDLAAGADTLRGLLLRARSPQVSATSGVVSDVAGTKVGLVGACAGPDAAGAMQRAVRDVTAKGAKIVVGLAAMPRGDAKRLAEAVPELTVLVVGSNKGVGDANDTPSTPELLGRTLVVEPSNHLQTLGVVDLFVRGDSYAFQDGSGVESQDEIASLAKRIAELEARIATWQKEGKVNAADLSARKDELAKMIEKKKSLAEIAPPKSGSFFRYSLVEIKPDLGKDPKVKERMAAYYQRVNEHNKLAFAGRKPPPVPAGASGYVGVERCSKCHKEARAVWNATPHARAYATLADEHKEYNLECIGCHVTGYEKPGGSTVTENDELRDVQCETCHGPGEAHADKPTTPVARKPDLSLCAASCHHPPHVEGFDAEVKVRFILGPGHGR